VPREQIAELVAVMLHCSSAGNAATHTSREMTEEFTVVRLAELMWPATH
jgi:hypothetical protein